MVAILAQDHIAGIGLHVVAIVAVHPNTVLVDHADCGIGLVGEGIEAENIAKGTGVRSRTCHVGTDGTAVEGTVLHQGVVGIAGTQQVLGRLSRGIAVDEGTVEELTVQTVATHLHQHVAPVVTITTIVEIDIIEAHAVSLRKVYQRRGIRRRALPVATEMYRSSRCGWFKQHIVGLGGAGDEWEGSDIVVACREFHRGRTVHTATT